MTSADFLENGPGGFHDEDDDAEVDDVSHKKLLNAVSSLYRKQRIAAPKRNEPSQQISEFNLTKSFKKKLAPTQLLLGLSSKPQHQKIHSKVKEIKRKLKPLPKPLEQFEANKIIRETGYENVKEEVSKWRATIQRNRAADRLVFPLRNTGRLSMEPERDILGTFSKPTELELKMAEVLNKSTALQELKEEAKAEKMTLAQLIQRRNMIAKMRHRESYRIAKAVRQNKIKSKKYHRLLKKDKIRSELKEFELLQKTDPEAALAKLEKVERARAEERISLRHRNTGKWAKGLAVRAKYDAEARAELAQNLRKSRDLTDKLKTASRFSDSEDDSDGDEEELDHSGKAVGNPWVHPGDEIQSFVKGYRKFWEEQQKSEASQNVVGVKRKPAHIISEDETENQVVADEKTEEQTLGEVDCEDDGVLVEELKQNKDQPKRRRKGKKSHMKKVELGSDKPSIKTSPCNETNFQSAEPESKSVVNVNATLKAKHSKKLKPATKVPRKLALKKTRHFKKPVMMVKSAAKGKCRKSSLRFDVVDCTS